MAAVTDGALVDYALWRPGSPDGVGDIHRGRVTAIVPAMAAPNDASSATAVTKPLPRRLPNSPFSRKPANGRRGMSQSLLSMYGRDEE